MDFDALSFEGPGPRSRKVADVREAYLALAKEGLSRANERVGVGVEFQSNNDGHLAWDLSLYVRAACLMWKLTGDEKYLAWARNWAFHLCGVTDDAIGLFDWRGRSDPVWSAGSRYTAGAVDLGVLGGQGIKLQAASDRILVERPSSTTAVVRSIRSDGSVWTSPEASLLPGTPNYLPDVLSRRSSVHSVLLRGLKYPVDLRFIPAGEFTVEPRRGAHVVHTGLIVRSILQVAECLDQCRGQKASSAGEVSDLLEVGRKALEAHSPELIHFGDASWYVTPMEFPGRRLGLEVPHNHTVDVATSYMMLGRMLKDPALQCRGESMTRPFLEELSMYRAGELEQPWHYYPVRSAMFSGVTRSSPLDEREVPALRRAEDSSHALLRVRAMADWYRYANAGLPDSTMSAVANTFGTLFLTRSKGSHSVRWLPVDDDGPASRERLGLVNSYCGAWGAMAPWDRLLRRRMNSLAFRFPPTRIFGASVLSAAEIFAMNSRKSQG